MGKRAMRGGAGLGCGHLGSCSDSSADATFFLFSLILHQLQTLLWRSLKMIQNRPLFLTAIILKTR